MIIRILIISVLLSVAALYIPDRNTSAAERPLWLSKCASCHDGKTAPEAEYLVKKYKTVEEFMEAVEVKGHKGMNILKGSKPLIKKIAEELGIKEMREKHP